MSLNTGKIEKMMIILLIASLVSVNLYSQFSFDNRELISLNDQIILESKDDIIKVFHHLPMAELYFMEESLNLEDWMLDPSAWLSNNEVNIYNELSNEADLGFESWMLESNWLSSEQVNEDELNYESWMLSPLTWN